MFVAFEDVEASGGFEVEHDDRSFGRPYRETLGVHVEVDSWEAVDDKGSSGPIMEGIEIKRLTFGRRA